MLCQREGFTTCQGDLNRILVKLKGFSIGLLVYLLNGGCGGYNNGRWRVDIQVENRYVSLSGNRRNRSASIGMAGDSFRLDSKQRTRKALGTQGCRAKGNNTSRKPRGLDYHHNGQETTVAPSRL